MAELCRTGCVQNSGCGPRAVSENAPLLAAHPPIRSQSTKFGAAEFSKSPHR